MANTRRISVKKQKNPRKPDAFPLSIFKEGAKKRYYRVSMIETRQVAKGVVLEDIMHTIMSIGTAKIPEPVYPLIDDTTKTDFDIIQKFLRFNWSRKQKQVDRIIKKYGLKKKERFGKSP